MAKQIFMNTKMKPMHYAEIHAYYTNLMCL